MLNTQKMSIMSQIAIPQHSRFHRISLIATAMAVTCLCTLNTGCVTSTEGQGAALGSLAGLGIGALACQGKDQAKCMAAGALIGGGLGYAAGTVVAARQKQYANDEDFYDAQITQTAQLNRKLAADNKSLRASIKSDQRQVAALNAKYKRGEASGDQLKAAKSSMDQKRLAAQKSYDEAKKELEIQQTVLADMKKQGSSQSARVKKLDKEVKVLQTQIADLRNTIDITANDPATINL